MTLEQLEQEAMSLDDESRIRLAEKLYGSVTAQYPDIQDAWVQECERRMKAYDSGQAEFTSGEEFIQELRSLRSKT